MKKKLVAILIATAMSVSLVACGGDNSTADTKQETKTSVSAKDTKDTDKKEDSKKEDSKKKDSVDKKKSESEKKETEKKESEKKTEDKKETKTASSDTKKEEAKKTSTGNNNSTSKPSNSSNNSNSNNANNSQPSTPDNGGNNNSGGSAPTPTPPSKPNNDNNNSSSDNSDANKPAEKPAPHEHSYQVVSSTNGDCSHAGTVTKKCSCGDTITENGSYGDHNWQDQYKDVYHDAVYEEQPVYEWVAYWQCNKCGAQFDSVDDCGDHCIDCNSGYSTKKKQIQTGYTNVKIQEAYTERVPNGKKCTICGQNG